ncbi:MAG: hypothetical protein OES99_00705, partial [Gammaproteobacteria bacterium]|nr:hypothetical protein [Gammaproteobacteria bacterium]
MSFILDALQKAESLRGRQPVTAPLDQALGDIAEPPAVRSSWRIGALLAGVVATVLLTLYVLNPPDSKARLPVPVADTTTRTSFSTMASDTPLIDVATPATREVRSLNREAAHTPTRQVAPGSVSISPEPLADTSAPVTPGTVSVSQEPL